ncbi:TonB-dependent receptor [Roseateles saccharophilus]|uniref:TonB-dependent receptor n=1 Tax=Roseateles saccharophilus TaxID=304 RepID=A0A4R3VC41_ROSSA|nr:TonB-dependent receptor [Roseateles saccharophilus]TCV01158.1 TonB-dependent receptor [Roseateles saccharophilus]
MPKIPFAPSRLCLLIQAFVLLPAAAQTAPAPADAKTEALDTVVVSGIRASVRKALDTKEASNSQIEVIASEDIGKLPDTTIAESLARLPGMSAGIDRGNASQIVARGLGPRFVGATLNGREFASSEPDRAVRFEMFPSESVSGATIYKTQQADIAEGGIATTIDLQTVSPLDYKGRELSLKADANYYQLAASIGGAKKWSPRLGGIYVDQFANRTVGVALAFSYYDQPVLQDGVQNWGFDSGNGNKNPGIESWGFQNAVKNGTNKRSSVLGKLEYKPDATFALTGDVYAARSDIKEQQYIHTADTCQWANAGCAAAYSGSPTISGGYVTGGTLTNAALKTINGLWKQDMKDFATGLNAKWKLDDWQIDADLAHSTADRDTHWTAVELDMNNPGTGTLSWNFPKDGWSTYNFSADSGNPASFNNWTGETWGPTYAGTLHDKLDSEQLNFTRRLVFGDLNKLKFGLRATQREKRYDQTSWDYGWVQFNPSDLHRVAVSGRPDFVAFGNVENEITKLFGASTLSADGRTPSTNDLVAKDWRAKENSAAAYVQGDLNGSVGTLGYRGNVGLRLVHTSQTGYGNSLINNVVTPTQDGISYTRALPSLNLVLSLDENDENQLRFGMARALSRAPLDVMTSAQTVTIDPNGVNPTIVSGGNPRLKPMMADQIDLAYQRYFGKGNFFSAGLFYKQVKDYIGLASVACSYAGKAAYCTQQVNRDGGDVHGLELVYQQSFSNGLGLTTNYTYSTGNIKENGDQSGKTFVPISANGLMKGNGGLTVWYERNGFEARLSANHHTAYNRAPTWDSTLIQQNGAETWVSLNLSQKLDEHVSVRFGVENATNQKVFYTYSNDPYRQENFQFGRRFNVGVTYKL